MTKTPRTPCIGICSTGIGDDVCRGCKRFAQEVIHWNKYSAQERLAVMKRIDGFLQQIVATRFLIEDVELLERQIRYQQIAFDVEKDPHCWLFELLRNGAGQIEDIEMFGVQLRSGYGRKSLIEIKKEIDEEIYQLACSYYQRYVVPGIVEELA